MRFNALLLLIGFGMPLTLHAAPVTGTTAASQTVPTLSQGSTREDREIIKDLDILEDMDMYEHMEMYEYMNVFEQGDEK
jgi:hypothetical protein